MTKIVLTTASGSIYDDLPESQYHFPQTYLRAIERAIGDGFVYYEPRRDAGPGSSGGRQSYFASGRIGDVVPDLTRSGHYYARIVDYTEFDRPVPFHDGRRTYERGLTRADGGISKGAFGRSVRQLSEDEFTDILAAGIDLRLQPWEREEVAPSAGMLQEAGAATPIALVIGDSDATSEYVIRPRIQQILTRPFRDVMFKRHVRQAYQNTCCVTGLRLINGGGRPEVQAAHIRAVESNGPDVVRNGLALTATAHWLFDRGLISVSDDLRLLISPHGIPHELDRLLHPDRRLVLPADPRLRPHPTYLRWHRETRFKA